MITYLNYKDLKIIKDLKKLGTWKFKATGEDPILEIRNLPDSLIRDISIVLKAEHGEIIEVYWSYEKDKQYSDKLYSSSLHQTLEPGVKGTYTFSINAEEKIKKLRIDPTNASGIIEIEEIKIRTFYIPPLFEENSKKYNILDKFISNNAKKLKKEETEVLKTYTELLSQNKLLQSRVKQLEEEKAKLVTVPNYKGIKKIALKGKNGYLFLVNDSNQEIRQHFDNSYNNKFNAYLFKKSLKFKKTFCTDNNIEYSFFITPDKSLVCKDFLPFDVKLTKRNYDSIKNLVPDFVKNLDHTCYFKNNSHINYSGGKELSYSYLHYIDPNFKRDDFNKLIDEQIQIGNELHNGDLTRDKNWSYSDEEKEEYLKEKVTAFKNECLIDLSEDLPEKFKLVKTRKTEHYKNPEGLKKLRVLIFRDSSLDFLKDILSIYFKDILLYWDHWFFNKELVEWYKPDIILEIRTERFLENMIYEINNQ
ncbi:hypothetical protein [Methanobacterium paludis]|uniref:Uncharacterized protein n=1 Tax=Methanobacterium paludis (strain DSM 25820 / JCM 18151 / SWAN1) TaxID=868131 RepID=F6D280_METPW|nr:hypothetical protein [Methanobacterium paludis]AEG18597.1 hypothetical protein MSWAN_1586 [Methanobacterium paludis]